MCTCAICGRDFSSETPRVFAMGAYGNPKYVCDECGDDFEIALGDRDVEKIADAMDRIGKKMASSNPDGFTYKTVNEVMAKAGERAKLIKAGEYDFALDEMKTDGNEDGFDEVPEELRETEEDRELDAADEEKMRTFDKIYNIILTCLIIAFAGFLTWRILDVFVFK